MAESKPKKRWIKAAVANAHGQFRKKAEAAGETTREYADEHAGDSGKVGKEARLAKTLMGMRHKGKETAEAPKKSRAERMYSGRRMVKRG